MSERWAHCDDAVHHMLTFLDAKCATVLSRCGRTWRETVLSHACRTWSSRLGGASPWRLCVPASLRGGVQEGRLETAHHLRSAVQAFAISFSRDDRLGAAHPWKPVFASGVRNAKPDASETTASRTVQVVWRTAFSAERWVERQRRCPRRPFPRDGEGGASSDPPWPIVLEYLPREVAHGTPPHEHETILGGGALWIAVRVLDEDARGEGFCCAPDVADVTLHIYVNEALDTCLTSISSVAFRVLRSQASGEVWYMLCNAGIPVCAAHRVVGKVCPIEARGGTDPGRPLEETMRIAEVRAVVGKLPLPPTYVGTGAMSRLLPARGDHQAAHYVCRPWESVHRFSGTRTHPPTPLSRIPDASAEQCARHAVAMEAVGAPFRACVYNPHTEMTSIVANDTVDVALWLEWLRVGRSDVSLRDNGVCGSARSHVFASPEARMRIPMACGCGPVRTWTVRLL